jgi:hypothetical protein
MDPTIIFIVVFLIVVAAAGGYFGYTKWWQPRQCVSKKATSNVSTFMWKDGKCIANVCVSGFTGDDCSTVDTSCPIPNCKTCGSDHTCTKCIDGYGDGINKPVSSVCPVYTPIFKLTGTLNTNKCEKQFGSKDGTLITPTTNAASQSICEQICIGTQECNAYDWNSGDGNQCELWKGTVQADSYSKTSKNYTCYRKPTSS